MKNNFRNFLILWENKLFSTKFREKIIYYMVIPLLQKLFILIHCVGLRLVEIIIKHMS